MIFNMVGGGGGRKTVTLNAPKNSTVSWTGTESGSVPMGSQTQAAFVLKAGTYTFANTLTIDGTNRTIFTKTVAVTDDMTVNLYPDGAIFWYGIDFIGGFRQVHSGTNFSFSVGNYQLNGMGNRTSGSSSTTTGIYASKNSINASGKTKAHVILSATSTDTTHVQTRVVLTTTVSEDNPSGSYINVVSASFAEREVYLSNTGNLYVEVCINPISSWSSGAKQVTNTVYAIWLD